jgi:VanZ family protein
VTSLRGFRRPAWWLSAWIAMLVATVVVCLARIPDIAPQVDYFDKIEHLVGYALLAAYAAMLFATRRALGAAALGLVALGVLIELLQSMTSWRSADAGDVLANATGVVLGMLVAATPLRSGLQWVDRRLA